MNRTKEQPAEAVVLDNPLFDGIKKDEIAVMLGCLGAYSREYDKSNFIYLEQDQVRSVGIVLEGTVAMLKEDLWATKTVVVIIGESEILGETFACGREPYASTVSFQALSSTRILFLPFERVMHTCKNSCAFHQSLIGNMLGLIADKNMQMINKINIMSQKTLREKIAAYLSDLALKNHGMYFESPLGRVQLAEYLGADRSALTRELNAMKAEGLIDFDRNTFHILKKLYE